VTGGGCGEVLGVGCPGRGETLDGQFKGVQRLGKREAYVVMVPAVEAGHAARRNGDAVTGGDMSKRVSAVEGELSPQRQSSRR
jgi:hypothetical protein